MPKSRRGAGSIYKKDGFFYIKYHRAGIRYQEATRTKDRATALARLQKRLGEITEGRFAGPFADRVTVSELLDDLITDYAINGKRSLKQAKIRVESHLRPYFGKRKAQALTTAHVNSYIAKRQESGAANATVNRELAALKRAYNLAVQSGIIHHKPHFPHLRENNVRQGFFERAEFDAILARLPAFLRPLLTFAYFTGWRTASELLPLTWAQVDLQAGTVRLYTGTTKNDAGRLIHLPQVLWSVLEAQEEEHRASFPACPYVFHRSGKRIKDFRKAWANACQEAGQPGKIPHDFRRTAVRNLVQAGVPERVAMSITGHKTRSVFDRYHIVSDGDLREAARKIDHATAQESPSSDQAVTVH